MTSLPGDEDVDLCGAVTEAVRSLGEVLESPSQPRVRDKELLNEVTEAVRSLGQVPESVRDAGRAAFTLRRRTDAGLASIDYDSLLDEDVLLRAPEGPRIVVFRADSLTIDIAIEEDHLVGQIIPAAAGEITMMTVEGAAGEVTADEMGCFVLPAPSPGPTRFRCRIDGCEVFTDWLRV